MNGPHASAASTSRLPYYDDGNDIGNQGRGFAGAAANDELDNPWEDGRNSKQRDSIDDNIEEEEQLEEDYEDPELLNDARRFQDFETIDWIQDTLFERSRRLREARQTHQRRPSVSGTTRTRRRSPSSSSAGPHSLRYAQLRAWYHTILHATQSWLVVTLVGAGIGLNAALIDVITSWLTDVKFGYCRVSWWLNSKFCCWEIDPIGSGDDGSPEGGCQDWHNWSESFFGLGYLIYVSYAVAFAFSAAFLVRSFAPYAAGSGISEIKCILAGFIMKGFLGLATLVIKSLTLVGFNESSTIASAKLYLCSHWLSHLGCLWAKKDHLST